VYRVPKECPINPLEFKKALEAKGFIVRDIPAAHDEGSKVIRPADKRLIDEWQKRHPHPSQLSSEDEPAMTSILTASASMDFGNLINSVMDILKSKPSVSERYKSEIDWLKERKDLWSKNKIRIGVLGVTSSGKSTLINAVIGMELLSTAVKPTSGQLVSCYKGEPRTRISFKSSPDRILKDHELCLENVRKYSDENENRENKEKVAGIEIYTPDFDFGDDVVLIDSAGLDAYKLEAHERLSLEYMLPTIDMCIFVTSLKTSSDQKAKTVLNAIAKHDCPLLIVQNMLDSVEPSADGMKSKDQVAQDHKNRLIKIINESNIKDKSSVQIVQISALYAMEEKCRKEKAEDDSHYTEFKAEVNDMIEKKKPTINEGRCRAIVSECCQLIEEEEKKLSGKSTQKSTFRYERLKEQIQNNIKSIDKELEKALSGLEAEYGRNYNNQSISIITDNVKKYENDILSAITKTNSYIFDDISKRLNIPSRDLNMFVNQIEYKQPDKIPEPKEIKKNETKERRVERTDGLFGGRVARFFGGIFNTDWGWEYEKYTVETIDKARTNEEIKNYIKRTSAAHARTVQNWRENLEKILEHINSFIDEEYSKFKDRQKEIENTLDVKNILDGLKILIKGMNLSEKTKSPNTIIEESRTNNINLSRMELSKYQLGLYAISKSILHSVSKAALEKCREAINAPLKKVVLGWDVESMRDFVIRFMGISFESEELEAKKQITVQDIICASHPCAAQLKDIKNNGYPASFFIMVNAQQDGKAKNDIKELALKDNLKDGDKVFFVVQDFDSLVNSGGITEMKTNLREYYKEFQIIDNKGFILINDDNPMYNISFVQDQLEPCNSIQEEQKLLKLLKESLPFLWDTKTAEITADLIRN